MLFHFSVCHTSKNIVSACVTYRKVDWHKEKSLATATLRIYLVACLSLCHCMGWLRFKLQVSFAKEPYKRDYILQKRPIIVWHKEKSLATVTWRIYVVACLSLCYLHTATHCNTLQHLQHLQHSATHTVVACLSSCHCMGWLRLVGSFKLYVSFAKEPHKIDYILRKRPTILRSLLIVATP